MDNQVMNLQLVQKQFLCCVAIDKINVNEDQLNVETQKELLNLTVNDKLVQKFPVKPVYQQKFLRQLVQNLVQNNREVSDELYEAYCGFLSTNDTLSTHYRHFLMSPISARIDRIIIQESKSIISAGTTGLCSWQAAEVLAEWCRVNKAQIQGKSVLELGAGVGLAGLTVINICSPSKYTFTDCHPRVLELLQGNVHLHLSTLSNNNVPCPTQVEVLELAWEAVDEYAKQNRNNPDVILAADVVYDPTTFPALITALKTLLGGPGDSYAIIAITIRNKETVEAFKQALVVHELVHVDELVPSREIFLPLEDVPVVILKILPISKI